MKAVSVGIAEGLREKDNTINRHPALYSIAEREESYE